MKNYLQAGEIRRQYPEFLTRQQIDEIINEWERKGIERIDTLKFSSMFDPQTHKLNMSELELTLRAEALFHFKHLEPFGKRAYYGSLAVVYFENLTGYRDPHEVEKETYDLRLQIGAELLDRCSKLDIKELLHGFDQIREIRAETSLKYKLKPHPWQKKLDKLVDKYILKDTV